jgi:hypothetical protein
MTVSTIPIYKITITDEERASLVKALEVVENTTSAKLTPKEETFVIDPLNTFRSPD